MSSLGSITMADESKSNHLVLLNLLEIKIIVLCAVAYLQLSKTQFHPIESFVLEANLKPKVLCTNHYSAANGDALNS
jgi:hypothetical protein